MQRIFTYKQRVFSKYMFLIFALVIAALSYMTIKMSIIYFLGIVAVVILIDLLMTIYTASKKLIIRDEGIQEIVLFSITTRGTLWNQMEEASLIINVKSVKRSGEARSAIHWITNRYVGNTIKIIVTDQEPIYIQIASIKNGEEIMELLKDRVKIVKD